MSALSPKKMELSPTFSPMPAFHIISLKKSPWFVRQDLPFMKPCWLVYFSRCFLISSFINVSRALPSTKVRCAGLLYPGCFSQSFFPSSPPNWSCIYFSLLPWCLPCLKGAQIKIFIDWTSNLFSDLVKDSPVHNSYYFGASRDFNLYKIYSSTELSYPRNFASIQPCEHWGEGYV